MQLRVSILLAMLLMAGVQAHSSVDLDRFAYSINLGDNPVTDSFEEPSVLWTFALHVHPTTNLSEYEVPMPFGFETVLFNSCTGCSMQLSQSATKLVMNITLPDQIVQSAQATVILGGPAAFGLTFATNLPAGASLAYHIPVGMAAIMDGDHIEGLPETGGKSGLTNYVTRSATGPVVVSFLPASQIPDADNQDSNPWLFALAGLAMGMVLWSVLVSQGVVQKRSRKQAANQAAHVELQQTEGKASLELRKEMLRAALLKLEQKKQEGGINETVYETLKSEYKKETVAVMRALQGDSNA